MFPPPFLQIADHLTAVRAAGPIGRQAVKMALFADSLKPSPVW